MFRLSSRITVFVIAVISISHAGVAAPPQPPNIVLIVSDDQGYRDLGCFGSDEVKTPHLDQLAKQGVRCTDFYVTWPACTPSRGSILTGRYPQRNGLYDMIRNDVADYGKTFTAEEYAVTPERVLGMDVQEVMVSEVLKQSGYATAVFGKWDGGQLRRFLPLQNGFDRYYGFANTGIDYFTHERYGVPSMFRDNQPTTAEQGTYCTYLFQNEAARFVKEHKDQPFFLYLPFNAPHGASNLDPKIRGAAQAPERYKKMYPQYKDKLVKGKRYGQEALVPSKQKGRLEYLASITCMDDAIGEVLGLLDEYELADNTLVVFFSDNGGSGSADNSPLRGRKGLMFEGGIRVPFIARYPGRIPADSVSNEFLTALELFPMFARLAGAKLPEDIVYDGFNMLPVLTGEKKSERTEMFWERRGDRAARVGNYKWVQSKRGTGLYDLSSDIGEKHDLSAENPEMLAKLQTRFAQWKKEMAAAEPRGPFRDF
ncbi:Arylsulfatase [Symmachiella dynata]|uniref:sulfatase family protein n=1 Tax=Symmachiella dynata TaxID=2527995 RepID=UPI001188E2DA|nr:sulfatase-like hydrolase/transferase [Symmachiella dynata]QDT49227.1 Arylsulfatase [Symmachiella dynata]